MKFKSARSIWITVVIWAAIALLAFNTVVVVQHGGPNQWFLVLTTLIAGMLLWMLLGTYYVVANGQLKYRSGPVNGSIAVNSIRRIDVSKTMYVGLKPALAAKGCVVYYNKYDDIYLSPQNQEAFIVALLEVNPGIVVVPKCEDVKKQQ